MCVYIYIYLYVYIYENSYKDEQSYTENWASNTNYWLGLWEASSVLYYQWKLKLKNFLGRAIHYSDKNVNFMHPYFWPRTFTSTNLAYRSFHTCAQINRYTDVHCFIICNQNKMEMTSEVIYDIIHDHKKCQDWGVIKHIKIHVYYGSIYSDMGQTPRLRSNFKKPSHQIIHTRRSNLS